MSRVLKVIYDITFKLNPEVDPGQIQGHMSNELTWVTGQVG
jgi:xanthine dehydrogenase molybdopterin-binding subunit B